MIGVQSEVLKDILDLQLRLILHQLSFLNIKEEHLKSGPIPSAVYQSTMDLLLKSHIYTLPLMMRDVTLSRAKVFLQMMLNWCYFSLPWKIKLNNGFMHYLLLQSTHGPKCNINFLMNFTPLKELMKQGRTLEVLHNNQVNSFMKHLLVSRCS